MELRRIVAVRVEHALRPRILVLLAVALSLGLGLYQLLAARAPLANDQQLLSRVAGLSSGPFQELMAGLYRLTGKGTMPLLVLLALMLLALGRRWAELRLMTGACGGIYIWVDLVLKPLVGRPRPPAALLSIDGSSFPSGHAAGAVVFSLVLAVVAAGRWPAQRQLWLLLSGAWMLLVGLSALVVKAHWPSDIIAGYALGLAWLGLCLAVWRQTSGPSRHRWH